MREIITMARFLELVELPEAELNTEDGRKLHADGLGWDKQTGRHLMRLDDELPCGEDVLVRAGKHLYNVLWDGYELKAYALTAGGKSCCYNVLTQSHSQLG